MSKKTKRIVVPKPTIKETTMPIDPALFNPSSSYRYRTDLDKELAEEDFMDARDLKRLRIREITAKREARIKQFERQSRLGNPGDSSGREREELLKTLFTNPTARKEWLELDNASRATLLETANFLTAKTGETPSVLSPYLSFMMMQMRQNPQTSVQELVALVNVIRPIQATGKSETAELIFTNQKREA